MSFGLVWSWTAQTILKNSSGVSDLNERWKKASMRGDSRTNGEGAGHVIRGSDGEEKRL